MDSMEYLIGIDIGTSGVKIGAFSTKGEARLLLNQPFRRDPLDPDGWWHATCVGLRKISDEVGAAYIDAICVGGQGPTLVAIDRSGGTLPPAVPWSDSRSAKYAERVSQLVGHKVHAGWSYLLRVIWLREEEPDRYAQAAIFLQPWDLINYRLTGVLVGSEIAGGHPWPPEELEALGLPVEKFVKVQEWGVVIGGVSRGAADITGLSEGTPVIGACGDGALSLLGAPGLEKGIAHNEGGSSGGVGLLWDNALEGEGLLCAPSAIPGLWIVGGPTSSSGRAMHWILREILGRQENIEDVIAQALASARLPQDLIFLPYLDGERTPVWDDGARGILVGLSLATSAEHCIAAVIEGITLNQADILNRAKRAGAALTAVTVTGAQANNPGWNQLKADIFGVPVYVPQVTASTCLGAAAVAGWGLGIWPDAATGGRAMSRVQYECQPSSQAGDTWEKRLDLFRSLYQQTRGLVEASSRFST